LSAVIVDNINNINNIVDNKVDNKKWLLTKFEDGLNLLLHKADDDAVMWLESTVTVALANKNSL